MRQRSNLIFAKKGQSLVCNTCLMPVYEFTKTAYYGDIATANILKGIHGFPNPEDGQEAQCPNCAALLLPGGCHVA